MICIYIHFDLLTILLLFIDKTNALKYELYTIICQINGAGFSAAYLFLDNAKKIMELERLLYLIFFKN